MKKLILLILLSVAVWGNNYEECGGSLDACTEECLGGSVEACDVAAVAHFQSVFSGKNCKDYMKVIRKGCNLGSGRCCASLGDEFHPISKWKIYSGEGRWEPKYGLDCSLRNQNEAFKYYKKSCDLGESYGCGRYTELQDDLDDIDRRERDKTHKSDITIRRK